MIKFFFAIPNNSKVGMLGSVCLFWKKPSRNKSSWQIPKKNQPLNPHEKPPVVNDGPESPEK